MRKRVGGKIRNIGRKRHVNEPAQHPPTAEERMAADQQSAGPEPCLSVNTKQQSKLKYSQSLMSIRLRLLRT